MAPIILDGLGVAQKRRTKLKSKITRLVDSFGRVPGLALVCVGDDPASKVYLANKSKACREVGIKSSLFKLDSKSTFIDLKRKICSLNDDATQHGILVQLPLPPHLNQAEVMSLISPGKDVDGFNPITMGNLFSSNPGLRPCTPKGIVDLIDQYKIPIEGKHAVIVGRSMIVGKPIGMMLLERNATITICSSKTVNLSSHTRLADILIVAVGKREFIDATMVKRGAVVVDVGINRLETGKLRGDVDFASVKKVASFISPVPGGIGPMTVVSLLENTVQAFEASLCANHDS